MYNKTWIKKLSIAAFGLASLIFSQGTYACNATVGAATYNVSNGYVTQPYVFGDWCKTTLGSRVRINVTSNTKLELQKPDGAVWSYVKAHTNSATCTDSNRYDNLSCKTATTIPGAEFNSPGKYYLKGIIYGVSRMSVWEDIEGGEWSPDDPIPFTYNNTTFIREITDSSRPQNFSENGAGGKVTLFEGADDFVRDAAWSAYGHEIFVKITGAGSQSATISIPAGSGIHNVAPWVSNALPDGAYTVSYTTYFVASNGARIQVHQTSRSVNVSSFCASPSVSITQPTNANTDVVSVSASIPACNGATTARVEIWRNDTNQLYQTWTPRSSLSSQTALTNVTSGTHYFRVSNWDAVGNFFLPYIPGNSYTIKAFYTGSTPQTTGGQIVPGTDTKALSFSCPAVTTSSPENWDAFVGPAHSPNTLKANWSVWPCSGATKTYVEIWNPSTNGFTTNSNIVNNTQGNTNLTYTLVTQLHYRPAGYIARFISIPTMGVMSVQNIPFNIPCTPSSVSIGSSPLLGPSHSPNIVGINWAHGNCDGPASIKIEVYDYDTATLRHTETKNNVNGTQLVNFSFASLPYTLTNKYTIKVRATTNLGAWADEKMFSFACGSPALAFQTITNVGPTYSPNQIKASVTPLACSGNINATLNVYNGASVERTVPAAVAASQNPSTQTFSFPSLPYTATNEYRAVLSYVPASGGTATAQQIFNFACPQTDFTITAPTEVGPTFSPNKVQTVNNPQACHGASTASLTIKDLSSNLDVVGPLTLNGVVGASTSSFTFAPLAYTSTNSYRATVTYTPASGLARTRTQDFSFACAPLSAAFKPIDEVGPDFVPNKISVDFNSSACNGASSGKLEIFDGPTKVREVDLSGLAPGSQVNSFTFAPLPETAQNAYTARVTYTPTAGMTVVENKAFSFTCRSPSISFKPIVDVGPEVTPNKIIATFTPRACSGLTNMTMTVKSGASQTPVRTVSLNGINGAGDQVFSFTPELPYTATNNYTADVIATPERGGVAADSKPFTFTCGEPTVTFEDISKVGPSYTPNNEIKIGLVPLVCSGSVSGLVEIFKDLEPTPTRSVSKTNLSAGSESFVFPMLPYTTTNSYNARATYTTSGGKTKIINTPLSFPCGQPSFSFNPITEVGPVFSPNKVSINAQPHACSGAMTGLMEIFDGANKVSSGAINTFTSSGDKIATLNNVLPYTATNAYVARATVSAAAGGSTVKTSNFTLTCPAPTASFKPITTVGGAYSPNNEILVSYSPEVCVGQSIATLEILDNGVVVRTVTKSSVAPSNQTIGFSFPTLGNNAENKYTAKLTVSPAQANAIQISEDFSFPCPVGDAAILDVTNAGPTFNPNEINVNFAPQVCGGATKGTMEILDGASVVRTVTLNNLISSGTNNFSFAPLPETTTNIYNARVTYEPLRGPAFTRIKSFTFGCTAADVSFKPITQVGPAHAENAIEVSFTEKACAGITNAVLKVLDSSSAVIRTVNLSNVASGVQRFSFAPLPYTSNNSYTAQVTYSAEKGPAVTKSLGFNFACGQTDFDFLPVTSVGPEFAANSFSIQYKPLACSGASNAAAKALDGSTVVATGARAIPGNNANFDIQLNTQLPFTSTNNYTAEVTVTPLNGTAITKSMPFTFACGKPSISIIEPTDVGPAFTPNKISAEYAPLICTNNADATLKVFDGASLVRTVNVSGIGGVAKTVTFDLPPLNYTASNKYKAAVTVTPTNGGVANASKDFSLGCPNASLNVSPIVKVGPAYSPNEIKVTYNAEVCAGNADITLTLKDGATIVDQKLIPAVTPRSSPIFTFNALQPTATNEYIASFHVKPASVPEFGLDKPFKFDCGRVNASFNPITNVGPDFATNEISVKLLPQACSAASVAKLEVLDENNVVVHEETRTGLIGSSTQNFTLSPLPYTTTNGYIARMTYTPTVGEAKIVETPFYLACGMSSVSLLQPTNVGPAFTPNKFTFDYEPLVCSGTATALIKVFDGANEVASTTVNLNGKSRYTGSMAPLPYTTTNEYSVTVTANTQRGQPSVDSKNFSFACGKPDVTVNKPTLVGPSHTPNVIEVDYQALACSGNTTVDLVVKDNGTTVRNASLNNVSTSGVYQLNFSPLDETVDNVHTAEAKVTPANGLSAVGSRTFSFDCLAIDATIDQITQVGPSFSSNSITVSGAKRTCSGVTSATLEIYDGTQVVRTVPKQVSNALGSFSFAQLPYTATNAYSAKLTITPEYGNKTIVEKAFNFDCGAPVLSAVNTSKTGPAYNPNTIAMKAKLHACSGETHGAISVSDETGVVRSAALASAITSTEVVAFDFNPLAYSSTNTYGLSATFSPTNGPSGVLSQDFTFPCSEPVGSFKPVIDVGPELPTNKVVFTYEPTACSGLTSLKLDIFDASSNTVVRTVNITDVVAQGDVEFEFASLPFTTENKYRADVTVTPEKGGSKSFSQLFTFACIAPEVSFEQITDVGPSYDPNKIGVNYTPQPCSGETEAILEVIDGATPVRSIEIAKLKAHDVTVSTFEKLPFTSSNEYTAKLFVKPMRGPDQIISLPFSFACAKPVLSFEEIKEVGPSYSPNSIGVNVMDYACSGDGVSDLSVSDASTGVEVRNDNKNNANQNPLVTHEFNSLSPTATNEHVASATYTPAQGAVESIQKGFAFACPDVAVTWPESANIGPQFDPNNVRIEYVPQNCSGLSKLTAKIINPATSAVVATVTKGDISAVQQNVDFDFASLPLNGVDQYSVEITAIPYNGDIKVFSKMFDVPCIPVKGAFEASDVRFGLNAMRINTSYNAQHSCNGSVSAVLVISNSSGEEVFNENKQGLVSGLGDVSLAWPMTDLAPGASYHAVYTLTNQSGFSVSYEKDFSIACPAAWNIRSLAPNNTGSLATFSVTDGYACNGDIDATLKVFDSQNMERSSEAASFAAADVQQHTVEINLSQAQSNWPGKYKLVLSAVDAIGNKKEATGELMIQCPPPDISISEWKVMRGVHDPFVAVGQYTSNYACHANSKLQMVVTSLESGKAVSSSEINGLLGNASSNFEMQFAPVQPGAFSAKFVATYADGQKLEKLFTFNVACPVADFTAVVTKDNVALTPNWFACHAPLRVDTVVMDNNGVEVGASSQEIHSGKPFTFETPWSILPSERGGEYRAQIVATDKNGVSIGHEFDFTHLCPAPTFTDIVDQHLDEEDDPKSVKLEFHSPAACNGFSTVAYEVRDLNEVVVKPAVVINAVPPKSTTPFDVVLPALGIGTYKVVLTAQDEADHLVEVERIFKISCDTAKLVGMGVSDANQEQFGAIVDVAACDLPMTAKIKIVNKANSQATEFFSAVSEAIDAQSGKKYFYVPPVDISSIGSGRYSAELVLSGSANLPVKFKNDFAIDKDGPLLQMMHKNTVVAAGQVAVVTELADVGLRASDTAGLLVIPEQTPSAHIGLLASDDLITRPVSVLFNEGKALGFVGSVFDKSNDQSGAAGWVGVKHSVSSKRYSIPFVKRHIDLDLFGSYYGSEVQPSSFGALNSGYLAVADSVAMDEGDYEVEAVYLDSERVKKYPVQGVTFTIAHPGSSGKLNLLGSVAYSIPMTKVKDDALALQLDGSYAAGQYTASAHYWDKLGNKGGELTQALEIKAKRVVIESTLPLGMDNTTWPVSIKVVSSSGSAIEDDALSVNISSPAAGFAVAGIDISSVGVSAMLQRVPNEANHYVMYLTIPSVFEETSFEIVFSNADIAPVDFRLKGVPVNVVVKNNAPTYTVGVNNVNIKPVPSADSGCRAIYNAQVVAQQILNKFACVVQWDAIAAGLINDSIDATLTGAFGAQGTFPLSYSWGVGITDPISKTTAWNSVANASHDVVVESPSVPTATLGTQGINPLAPTPSVFADKDSAGIIKFLSNFPGFEATITNNGQVITRSVRDTKLEMIVSSKGVQPWQELIVPIQYKYGPDLSLSAGSFVSATVRPDIPLVRVKAKWEALAGEPTLLQFDAGKELNNSWSMPSQAYGTWMATLLSSETNEQVSSPIELNESGAYEIYAPGLPVGQHRMQLMLYPKGHEDVAGLIVKSSPIMISVMDAAAISGSISASFTNAVVPFNSVVNLKLDNLEMKSSVGEVRWETSLDGTNFTVGNTNNPLAFTMTIAMQEPAEIFVRASILNKASRQVTTTNTLKISGSYSKGFMVEGDRSAAVGTVGQLKAVSASNAHLHYEWHVTPRGGQTSVSTGEIMSFDTTQPAVYGVVVYAEEDGVAISSTSYKRTMQFTVYVPSASIPVLLLNRQMEVGQSYTVTPFPGRLSAGAEELGFTLRSKIVLPDGSERTDTAPFLFTPSASDFSNGIAKFRYSHWVEGFETESMRTSEISVSKWEYSFPQTWIAYRRMPYANTPAPIVVITRPADYKERRAMGNEPVAFTYSMPGAYKVTPNTFSATAIYVEPGTYSGSVDVSDTRGNQKTISIEPFVLEQGRILELDIDISTMDRYKTAPFAATIKPKLTSSPRLSKIQEFKLYVDGVEQANGTSNSWNVVFTRSGRQRVKLYAKTDLGHVAITEKEVDVLKNVSPTCTVTVKPASGVKSRIEGGCSDVDGGVVKVSWFVNGEPQGWKSMMIDTELNLSANTRIELKAEDNKGGVTSAFWQNY